MVWESYFIIDRVLLMDNYTFLTPIQSTVDLQICPLFHALNLQICPLFHVLNFMPWI